MAKKENDKDLTKKLDILAMIEFAKVGVDRKKVRTIMGSLDNNLYSKIKVVFNRNKKNKNETIK